jgi:uncharacterized protein HemY
MGRGLTFDTGALIALERRRLRMRKVQELAHDARRTITVPAAVLTEWWRKKHDARESILASLRLEPLHDALARLAGEALASTGRANAIDAIVMASAAQRGDVVLHFRLRRPGAVSKGLSGSEGARRLVS